jgi:hypothetical protein
MPDSARGRAQALTPRQARPSQAPQALGLPAYQACSVPHLGHTTVVDTGAAKTIPQSHV